MTALFEIQQRIRDVLVAELSRYAAIPEFSTFAWIVPLGIVFGAVHALTPGHSKMVLATYVVGSRLSVLRSVSVSFALAFVHVATAVVLAIAASALVRRTVVGAGRAPALEAISGVLLALLGLWFLWRGLRNRGHLHNEGLLVGGIAGLIPCPLTLFTMFYAQARGVPEIGIAFAVMMMIGVALTLTAVAGAAAFARNLIVEMVSRKGNFASRLLRLLDVAMGVLLIAAGLVRASGIPSVF